MSTGLPARDDVLVRGADELGLALSAAQLQMLEDYLALLVKWNDVYNLTAIRDRQRMITHHLLDVLAIVPIIERLAPVTLLDVGTGAGLPGVVLAVAIPQTQVMLVDAVQKKTAFLVQVKAELGLDVQVAHARVEALTFSTGYDCIVSRAFASLSEMVLSSSHLLAPGGHFVAMKASLSVAETAALPASFRIDETVALAVPGLDAQRCAVIISQSDGRS